MKPCGCSGGQLGGLDRRPAVLNRVPRQRRLVIDTGSLVAGDGEQDLLKFSTIMQAFRLPSLGYDLVNMTADDLDKAFNLGLLSDPSSTPRIISGHKRPEVNVRASFSKSFGLESGKLAVTVAALDVESCSIEQTEQVFARKSDIPVFNMLILNRCDPEISASVLKELPMVDCLVCPADSDEPRLISEPDARPLVFSVGRFGKYVNRLRIGLTGTPGKLQVEYAPVDVNETLKPDSSLANLYRAYQLLVKEQRLLEKYPRSSLPSGLRYAGSKSCKSCHEYNYEIWSTKPHARAYATLVEVGSEYDPECVVCHVVGMKYYGGFISPEQTPNLKDVGCENCHGPGSEHNGNLGYAPTTEPKQNCTDCHTPEHSARYAGKKQEYLEKIDHWTEPKARSDVK
ncbi:MAG: cytochrome c family protein [Phycisphaerales bacterium]|nr:MAG: cytochrome c family protein [Phycisphaerales bacterium]